ncbi:hypothetical protein B0H13DRAFT_2395099 [Mycena leptocephala]|nr:hypothetical protein B0H13DRAFT_2395099 [Mycena leptocephala]
MGSTCSIFSAINLRTAASSSQFVPPWDLFSKEYVDLEPVEFHDVVQWLKTSPNPQPELIDHWQGYSIESMIRTETNYTNKELEKRWKNHLKREAYFHGPP